MGVGFACHGLVPAALKLSAAERDRAYEARMAALVSERALDAGDH